MDKKEKENTPATKFEEKLENGKGPAISKPISMNIVPLVSPFPKVYAIAQRGNIEAAEKSKEKVLPEVLVANIQPMV